jgi:hypothetical protein
MNAAEVYANRIDAVRAQRTRFHEGEQQDDTWGGATARRFRFDPRRQVGARWRQSPPICGLRILW